MSSSDIRSPTLFCGVVITVIPFHRSRVGSLGLYLPKLRHDTVDNRSERSVWSQKSEHFTCIEIYITSRENTWSLW